MKLKAIFISMMGMLIIGISNASAELTILKITPLGSGKAQVKFRYRNESDNTLATVKIICSARTGASRREKGIVYINNHLGGGLRPGFSLSGSVEVVLGGNQPKAIKCKEEPRSLTSRD